MTVMRMLITLLALCFSAGAAAQTAYKCKDKAGKVTYSTTECRLLGLQAEGEVADRMNTAPALKTPPRRPGAPQTAAPAAPPAPAAQQSAPPPPRDRRCFTVQTKTGPVTRCNEKPDEDAPADPAQSREVRAQ
jgi:hypothetical protein